MNDIWHISKSTLKLMHRQLDKNFYLDCSLLIGTVFGFVWFGKNLASGAVRGCLTGQDVPAHASHISQIYRLEVFFV